MTEKEKSAVSWLEEKLIGNDEFNMKYAALFQQAKQMEREQIETGIDIKELRQLLSDCHQVLNGFSLTDAWSKWDESVRQRVFDMYSKSYYFTKTYGDNVNHDLQKP